MKAINFIIILLLVLSAVMYFTKPSDTECLMKGKAVADANSTLVQTPGYNDPTNDNAKAVTPSEDIVIRDNFLWKEIKYIGKDGTKTLGYGYLGSFHPVKNTRIKNS